MFCQEPSLLAEDDYMWETTRQQQIKSSLLPLHLPHHPFQPEKNDGPLTTATITISIAVIDHSTTSDLMIFEQRKRIVLAFSLLRREFTLTLMLVVNILFRYTTTTVGDVTCPLDDITFREGRHMLYPRGVIFLQFGILLYIYIFLGILIYFIPFGSLNFLE